MRRGGASFPHLPVFRKGSVKDMNLRPYHPDDCPVLAALFFDTVHTVNCRDYSADQCDAWADGMVDLAAWNRSFLEHTTYVAEQDGQIVGFGDISRDGYLDRLYVHARFQRQGVATALCTHWKPRSKVVRSRRTPPSPPDLSLPRAATGRLPNSRSCATGSG